MVIGLLVFYIILFIFFIPIPFLFYIFEKRGKKYIWKICIILILIYIMLILCINYYVWK